MRRMTVCIVCILMTAAITTGCHDGGNIYTADNTAVIWSDCPEFVSYAELFNKQNSKYKIFAEYRQNVALALLNEQRHPDLVAGAWLKGEKTRPFFKSLNRLLQKDIVQKDFFYEPLLALGNANGTQYLLPVSFNIPAIMFHKDNEQLAATTFTLPLEKIKKENAAFNKQKKRMYTNIGFLPRYNVNFLYSVAVLSGAAFKESGGQFVWNQSALIDSFEYIKNWIIDVNGSTQQEDDFVFKYMYEPEEMLIANKRILMAYISSKDLFLIPRDKLESIDFRWLVKTDIIPLEDKIEYIGICSKSKKTKAAEAFLEWFFTEANQQAMIQRFFDFDMHEQFFGIAGGFSSIRSVNENILPKYYPQMIGHLPRLDSLLVPEILPSDWEKIKSDILFPYLTESLATNQTEKVISLGMRIENRKKMQH